MKTTKRFLAIFTVALMLGLVQDASAQLDSSWSRIYGGNSRSECHSLIQTADGGYALAGAIRPNGQNNEDVFLVRTDANGDTLWSRTFGGNEHDWCHSLIQTTDSGLALGGYTGSFGAGHEDFWLVRTDANGNLLWSRTFGGSESDRCYALVQTADGGFAMAGYTWSFGARDFWLVKTNANGDSSWSRTFGGNDDDECNSLVQTVDGGFALGGVTKSFGPGRRDFWLVKTNAAGDSSWSRTFGGNDDDDECRFLIQTADGGFALAGYSYSFGAHVGMPDFWLVKTNAAGDSSWSRTFGGRLMDDCYSLTQTTDGGYALAGYFLWGRGGNGRDFWLVKTDEDGDSLWSRTFGGERDDWCYSLTQTTDGGYALAGSTRSFNVGDYHFWLVKTSPPVSVFESGNPPISQFQLLSAYPNPFNAKTVITFNLPSIDVVQLGIYDLSGCEARTVDCGVMPVGLQTVYFDGAGLSAGTYLIRLQTGNFSASRQITLIK